uniref:zinc transporter ZIP1-like n=1 Tax=Styela clava TaxID=7725 RepID=UPI00193AA2D9|nr:zinc transporter ZIP1-like [Styela clava]
MQLIVIKLCVIFGLLVLTFTAACLPLLFLIPFLGNNNDYMQSSTSGTALSQILYRIFPCFKRRREGKLSTSSDISDENGSAEKENQSKEGRGKKTTLFLDVMNCFSGGVFLGTSFLALMPEIREIFDEVGITWPQFYSSTTNSTIFADEEEDRPLMPITELLVTSGLFLILCVEQVVHSITDRNHHKGDGSHHHESETSPSERTKVAVNGIKGRAVVKVTVPNEESVETEAVFIDDLAVDPASEQQGLTETESASSEGHEDHHNDSIVRSLILVTTLSMHSLLEGLAIGLQKTASSALSIFIAVLFHKSLMAFSMGNNLIQAGQSVKSILIAAAVLAMTSPVGIAVGTVMKETSSGTEIVNGVLQGIATGTFLFITFFEVLSKEFASHTNRVYKTIAFILGYCCILAVMFTHHGA